jgi:hypothetical protein
MEWFSITQRFPRTERHCLAMVLVKATSVLGTVAGFWYGLRASTERVCCHTLWACTSCFRQVWSTVGFRPAALNAASATVSPVIRMNGSS